METMIGMFCFIVNDFFSMIDIGRSGQTLGSAFDRAGLFGAGGRLAAASRRPRGGRPAR